LRTDGKETSIRVARVDHDGLVVLGAHFPDRIESRVIGLDVGAVGIFQIESEHFIDLQSYSAGQKTALQFPGGPCRPSGLAEPFKIYPGKMNNAIPEGLAYFHVLIEGFSESAVHIANHADAGIVHQLDQFFIVFGGLESRAMEMEIENRILGGS